MSLDHVKEISQEEWPRRTVDQVMTPVDGIQTLAPDEDMAAVLERLSRNSGLPLLVLEDGELRGVLTRADLARWIERAELLER